jgi:exosortase K
VRRAAAIAAALALAFGLKLYYAHATADGLRFILAPTARLVELASGTRFTYEPGSGYLCRERMFLIEKPCAGINFLVAAIVMSSVLLAGRRLALAIALCYVAAVVANAVRITIALTIARSPEAHRIEGVVVYFVALLGLCALVCPEGTRRWYVVPLLSYYAIALGIPLLRGGVPLEHLLVVLAVPVALVALVLAISVTVRTPATRTLSCR